MEVYCKSPIEALLPCITGDVQVKKEKKCRFTSKYFKTSFDYVQYTFQFNHILISCTFWSIWEICCSVMFHENKIQWKHSCCLCDQNENGDKCCRTQSVSSSFGPTSKIRTLNIRMWPLNSFFFQPSSWNLWRFKSGLTFLAGWKLHTKERSTRVHTRWIFILVNSN